MTKSKDSQHIAKEAAGKAAANLIQSGMTVGLGTGTTAAYFIAHLIERCKQGLQIHAVATSHYSLEQARNGGIPIAHVDELVEVDIVVDGADQIDPEKQMIKGGGGALLREKIVAGMSREMVVIADESKLVQQFEGCTLPVEIVPFAYKATLYHLETKGYKGEVRKTSHHNFFITENQNYIVDLIFPKNKTPSEVEKEIKSISGVVETGLFLGMAGRLIIGLSNGEVEIRE